MSEGVFALLMIAGILFFAFIIAPPKRKDEEEDNPASLRSGDVASLRDGEKLVTLTENLHPAQAESIQAYLKSEGIETYRHDKKPSLKNPLVVTETTLMIKKDDLEKVLSLMKQQHAPTTTDIIGRPRPILRNGTPNNRVSPNSALRDERGSEADGEQQEIHGCAMQKPDKEAAAIVVDQKYIEFNCPLCQAKVSFPESFKGQEEQCPFCLKNIIVS
ncbi:MAG: hypothetical protein HY811_10860 [Planctomycetes bacterium]|nr:hypothetical protein [Planctomycetota bacterium]